MEDPNNSYQNDQYSNNPNPNPQPSPYQNPMSYEDTSPLSIGNYLIMMLISLIPIVNLVMLFVWGFGNSNRNKKNWARAQLIMMAIGIVLSMIFGATIIAAIASLHGAYGSVY